MKSSMQKRHWWFVHFIVVWWKLLRSRHPSFNKFHAICTDSKIVWAFSTFSLSVATIPLQQASGAPAMQHWSTQASFYQPWGAQPKHCWVPACLTLLGHNTAVVGGIMTHLDPKLYLLPLEKNLEPAALQNFGTKSEKLCPRNPPPGLTFY